ncbi:MAG: hypothetical protein K2N63_17465 [Lachnospiraceae bacterium]|nr:hypothetical protein [Lachnospiraceae bacterium]
MWKGREREWHQKNKSARGKKTKTKLGIIVKSTVFLLLTGCVLAGSVPVSADDTTYRTTTVERGTLEVEATVQAVYSSTKLVPVFFNCKYGTASFVSYAINEGEYVGKGTPIINIQTSVDEIALEEVKLRLERQKKSCGKEFANMQAQYDAAKKAVEESSGTGRQIAQLRLEKLEMEQERAKRQLEEELAKVQEELDAYEDIMGMTQILAPETGYVTRLNYFGEGATLFDGTQVAKISSSEEALFTVKDENSVLRYGMRVSLKDGMGNVYDTTVVSIGDKYLSSAFTTKIAYLKPDLPGAWGFNAIYKNVNINNVLLVDAAAVRRDVNGDYVMELKDGELSKCYITIGKTVNNLCYAVDGLTEGMTVIIQ